MRKKRFLLLLVLRLALPPYSATRVDRAAPPAPAGRVKVRVRFSRAGDEDVGGKNAERFDGGKKGFDAEMSDGKREVGR